MTGCLKLSIQQLFVFALFLCVCVFFLPVHFPQIHLKGLIVYKIPVNSCKGGSLLQIEKHKNINGCIFLVFVPFMMSAEACLGMKPCYWEDGFYLVYIIIT